MKKILPLLVILIILVGILVEKDKIYETYNTFILKQKIENIKAPVTNEYYRENKFNYVQTTDDYVPDNKQELMNLIYTIISSGQTTYTFYCPTDYKDCIKDVNDIAENQSILSDINNFVHPYNSFKHIETTYDNTREVTITYTKNYTEEQIIEVNNRINYLFKKLYRPKDSVAVNLRRFHDYVANHAKYDSERADTNEFKYYSDIAYGPLIEGYALCGGYSDAIALYLDKMNITNYKVSSNDHVWNAIKINNKWYHLDLTWDDPITDTGQNYLIHDYFLITTQQLEKKAQEQHQFDKTIYSELQ